MKLIPIAFTLMMLSQFGFAQNFNQRDLIATALTSKFTKPAEFVNAASDKKNNPIKIENTVLMTDDQNRVLYFQATVNGQNILAYFDVRSRQGNLKELLKTKGLGLRKASAELQQSFAYLGSSYTRTLTFTSEQGETEYQTSDNLASFGDENHGRWTLIAHLWTTGEIDFHYQLITPADLFITNLEVKLQPTVEVRKAIRVSQPTLNASQDQVP